MELKRWVDSQPGVRIAGKPIGLFYDNPLETRIDRLRSEACFPIEGNVVEDRRFRTKVLQGGLARAARHTGPSEEYTKTYGMLLEGILSDGYSLDGPAREVFEKPTENLSPGHGIEILQLVSED